MDRPTVYEAAGQRLGELRSEARRGFALIDQLIRDGEPLPKNAERRVARWLHNLRTPRLPAAVQTTIVAELIEAGYAPGTVYQAVAEFAHIQPNAVKENYRKFKRRVERDEKR